MNSIALTIFNLFLLAVCVIADDEHHPLSDEAIQEILKRGPLWKPKRNFSPDVPIEYLQQLLGIDKDEKNIKGPVKHINPLLDGNTPRIALPENFDLRQVRPDCPSLWEIRDQGYCGSCWAISTAAAISDRICLHSGGAIQVRISEEHLTSCIQNGCQGGFPINAWTYYVNNGVVSGGAYGSNEGCQPYEIQPTNHGPTNPATPACVYQCTNPYFIGNFENDRYFGREAYYVDGGMEGIQREIYTNGPVIAIFDVYNDFYSYHEGVYHYVYGNYAGRHAVKLFGWGTEGGIPYWWAANSWNTTTFGDKGYFKILRGSNHVGIESDVTAAIPLLNYN